MLGALDHAARPATPRRAPHAPPSASSVAAMLALRLTGASAGRCGCGAALASCCMVPGDGRVAFVLPCQAGLIIETFTLIRPHRRNRSSACDCKLKSRSRRQLKPLL